MAISRYDNIARIKGGRQYATSRGHVFLRRAAEQGQIRVREHVTQEGERLDILAGREYGNAGLWWILAAASGIGWCLQVPPGTRILIPTDLSQVQSII